MAAEYYVLSMLYRKGLNAYLTLGNKKAVDIIVDRGSKIITLDVKGMIGKTLWPMDNYTGGRKNHFVIFVSFRDRMEDCEIVPAAYIVPSLRVRSFFYRNPKGTRVGVRMTELEERGRQYKDAWKLLRAR